MTQKSAASMIISIVGEESKVELGKSSNKENEHTNREQAQARWMDEKVMTLLEARGYGTVGEKERGRVGGGNARSGEDGGKCHHLPIRRAREQGRIRKENKERDQRKE
jgi:hypothetical protein